MLSLITKGLLPIKLTTIEMVESIGIAVAITEPDITVAIDEINIDIEVE